MMEHNDRQMILLAEPDMEESVLHRRSRAKHLKRRRRRFGFRLGISSLTLLMVIALMSVGGTFSKYTSQSPELTIPSLTAGNFAFEANMMTKEEQTAYQSELSLKDKQILACAFTVSNQDRNGIVCDVDMTCDLNFRCNFVVDSSKPYWEDFTIGSLKKLMQEELKVYLYVDGVQKVELTNELNITAPVGDTPFDFPMADPVTGYDEEMKFAMNFLLRDSNAISFKVSEQASTKKCAIVIDATGYNHQEGSLLRQLPSDPTITITANQVKGGM